MEIIVDPRFRDKIPKPSEEEYRQLEENILSDGFIREPLVVWKGRSILIDGHNRWAIYQAHSDVLPEPATWEMEFADEYAAEDWMLMNQLGRRNLNEMQITALRGQLYKANKKAAGNKTSTRNPDGTFQCTQNGNNGEASNRVSEQIANRLGVGKNTVIRAEMFVDGLDAAEEVVPGFKDEILSGHTSAKKSEIAEMRKMEPEQIAEKVEEIRNPKPKQHFPSNNKLTPGKVQSKEEIAIQNTDKRALNKNATVNYGIDDLLEELRAMHDEFFDKYLFALDIHRDVATDNPRKTIACLKEFETRWKNEVKEIFK